MAKNPAAHKFQLVHIQSPGTGADSLSKAQKEFNRLTKRIARLEKEVADFREAATQLRQRVQHEYRPLQARHNDGRAALVRQLDQTFDAYKLTKAKKIKFPV
ncbi:hypothetical protein [Hymenobacter rubidus]|uniref:hypothetical protein n=1 Tax=Hymenobacter rubidus TaxID=1441626 RepID=UPI00191ECD85|nr:hypothetical protein [Hymenobacter rubidus]